MPSGRVELGRVGRQLVDRQLVPVGETFTQPLAKTKVELARLMTQKATALNEPGR